MTNATQAKAMTLEEWRAKAIALFGQDEFQWRFVCPLCGHVQKADDFRPYKERGATPTSAYQECIGRYTGAREMKPRGEGPCNYAGYGLFRLSPVRVIIDGEELHAFAFDEGLCASAPLRETQEAAP